MKEEIFEIRYDGIQSLDVTKVYVENGEITKLHRCIIEDDPFSNLAPNGYYTYEVKKGDSCFEENVKGFIKCLWEYDKKKYNEFVAALNEETIDKYFYTAIVPKK